MYEIFMVVYLLVAMALIGLVLIQHGKGADMGAAFGAGASATVFGSSGTGNFLTKTTTILATLFFILSLVLGNLTASQTKQVDEWQNINVPVTEQPAKSEDDTTDIPVGLN